MPGGVLETVCPRKARCPQLTRKKRRHDRETLPELLSGAGVGVVLVVIIILGGISADLLRGVILPAQSLMVGALQGNPRQASVLSLLTDRDSLTTSLRYTEALVQALLGSQEPPVPQYQELAELVSLAGEEITYDSFSYEGRTLVIHGRCADESAARAFEESLESAHLFTKLELTGEQGSSWYVFELHCQ